MGFDTDDSVPQLQAADVIAWSARRNKIDKLAEEFAPLLDVLKERIDLPAEGRPTFHTHISLSIDDIKMWAVRINNWLTMTGEVPSFDDFLR